MGTFLQKTQAGSSNSSKNSVSASLSPYRHQLGRFHDLGTIFKGGRRLPFYAMKYRSIADSKQLLTSFQFHRWITKASEKHSSIASQPRGHFRELLTYYRNLSVSRKNIEPGLNIPELGPAPLGDNYYRWDSLAAQTLRARESLGCETIGEKQCYSAFLGLPFFFRRKNGTF